MRDADEDIKPYYLDDIKSLKRDLEKQSEVLNRLETLRNESKTLEEEIQQVRKTLISFDEFAKDATPEVLTTLIRSVVERIYVTTEKGECVMHIIIKGCLQEEYDSIFDNAPESVSARTQAALPKMCDTERDSKLLAQRCRVISEIPVL